MKRMWIGAGLLAVLLAAGLTLGTVMENRLAPGTEALRQAGAAALAEDWEKAEALADTARADWERVRCLAEGLAPHEGLEQIGIAFAQLPAYARRDGAAYSAICTALSRQLEALAKAHCFSWENIF